jgi:hypothetical protein
MHLMFTDRKNKRRRSILYASCLHGPMMVQTASVPDDISNKTKVHVFSRVPPRAGQETHRALHRNPTV